MWKSSGSFKLPRPQTTRVNTVSQKVQNGHQANQEFTPRFNSRRGTQEEESLPHKARNGMSNHDASDPHIENFEEYTPEQQTTETNRGAWGSKLEFLLSCISMSVGLGNVWRFPNVAYKNGGGAFLIPYLILLVVIGRPLYYMELILGQFSGCGPIKVWNCVPFLKGIGYAQMVSTFYIMVFYNYLMALTLFYLFASFQSQLPWTEQDQDWLKRPMCGSMNESMNDSLSRNQSLSEKYLNNFVLRKSDSLEDVCNIDYRLALCLLLAWICVFFSVIKGVESAGKVAYFTAIFPYTVLIALLVVAAIQEGAWSGIEYLFEPQWEKLLDARVWYAACQQSFFSLAVGYGALIMYSSYNDFKHNVYRDAIIISLTDTVTSILAGCVIFSVLGTLAHKNGKNIEDVIADSDMALAFVAYPEALAATPFVPQLWAVLFFIMFFTLGIGSSVAQIETILTPLRDKFPSLRNQKWKLALGMCITCFIAGLPLTTEAGLYIMGIIDNYGVGTAVFLYGILEVVGIMWIYGYFPFSKDVQFMLGSKPGIFWTATWFVLTPVALIVIFIYGNVLLAEDPPKPGIPEWGNILGWLLAGIAIMQIPIWAFWTLLQSYLHEKKTGVKLAVFRANENWGPKNPQIRAEWSLFKKGISPPSLEPPPPYTTYDNPAFVDSNFEGGNGHRPVSSSWEDIVVDKGH